LAASTDLATDANTALQADIDKTNFTIGAQEMAVDMAKDALGGYKEMASDASEEVSRLKGELQSANDELNSLTNPNLEGMGEFKNQIADIDFEIKKLELGKLQGVMAPEDADAQIEELRNRRRELELTRDITFDPQIRELQDLGDQYNETGVYGEKSFNAVKDRIQELGDTVIPTLESQLDAAQDHLDWTESLVSLHTSVVTTMEQMVTDSNTQLESLKAEFDGTTESLKTMAADAAAAWAQVLALKSAADGGSSIPSAVTGGGVSSTVESNLSLAAIPFGNGAMGYKSANITVELDGQKISRVVEVILSDDIRLTTGINK
jgi:chromosome segregation ATPase